MKRVLVVLFAFSFIMCPKIVDAQEFGQGTKIGESKKYIKTVTTIDKAALYAYNSDTVNWSESHSEEVTEKEYNEAKDGGMTLVGSAAIETTYKVMTTAIWDIGGAYQYVNLLHWKIMPSVRSYDIIGISHYSSIKASTTPFFQEYYCYTYGGCSTSNTHIPRNETYGDSSVFPLNTGSINYLDISIWFNIEKSNPNSTVNQIYAAGDYAHATSYISSSTASNYTMSVGGINLNSSISGYYDSIQSAEVWANVNL